MVRPGDTEQQFATLATDYLDDWSDQHPDSASSLGDHRFDDRLPDRSAAALAAERRSLDEFGRRLAALEVAALTAEHRVDTAILANSIERRIFELDELREHTWNPQAANPGRAIYTLLARDFAPLPDRLAALAGRLAQVPEVLAEARRTLADMPAVHIETAIVQFDGTIRLIEAEVGAALERVPAARAAADRVRPAALAALAEHRDWLRAQLASAGAEGGSSGGADGVASGGADGVAGADPRIGAERFGRKLSLTLHAEAEADALLSRAHADLDRIGEQITELAAGLGGSPAEVLARLGTDAPDEQSILRFCASALAAQTDFVRDNRLLTVYDDPLEIIEMPEINRGVAVAYCDSPGPLEATPLPTFLAVSPTPADWPAERVASFYREYNRHMVHNLMVHEAMPGHALQLQHARRFPGSRLRAAFASGAFIEGWAVYAEELMAVHGYPGEGDPRTVRMQQLKMQLRTTINAILDVRVHAHGMTEQEAMTLMMQRGYQEEGEAAGKWRRALLTSAQLSTYYVGYTEVRYLVTELRARGLAEAEAHDQLLAHGSPPVRLLRTVA